MKHMIEDTGSVASEQTLDGDDLIDLGSVSEETRGWWGRGFENVECMPNSGSYACP